MSKTVHIRSRAQESLREIRIYTESRYSKAQADKYLSGLRRKLELLAEHPRMATAGG